MTLVERLREMASVRTSALFSQRKLINEAADRIEVLETEAQCDEEYQELIKARVRTELEKAREALDEIGIGGNHLAHQLVTRVGPGFAEEYLPEDDPEIVLRRLGATVEYDMWCAWAAIMRSRRRAALSHKEG